MIDAIAMYGRLLGASVRSQMQYRTSFLLSAAGQFLATGIEFLGIWALFHRFGQLHHWTLAEVALFYGTINVTFAIADALATGFDRVGDMVRSGEFDRILLRPRSALLQIMGSVLALRRVGRLLQGMVVFGIAVLLLDVSWGHVHVAILALAIVGGVCLFLGLFMLQATMTFWTVESLEVVNGFTYGGVTAAQYPMTIYADWLRRFFTFVVPLACVSYLPLTLVLDKPDALGMPAAARAAAPLAGVGFLFVAVLVWRVGVRHYTSTGN